MVKLSFFMVSHFKLVLILLVLSLVAFVLLKSKKTKVVSAFPRELAKRIENALPHDAIKLYQSWLLKNLDLCYEKCQQKKSKASLVEWTNMITDKLVSTLNRVPKDDLYNLLEDRNKDNAFIALVFFTTLINALKPEAINVVFNKPVSVYREIFSSLQLKNSSEFLFREHYRLYELSALTSHQWHSLNFNADIEPHLRSTLEPQSLENNTQPSQPSSNTDVNELRMQENTDATPCQQRNNKTEPVEKAEEIEKIEKRDFVAKETVVDVDPQHTENTKSIETEQCEKFFKWLQRQIIRKPINGDRFFYQDSPQYGKNRIFITEFALEDFKKKTQITADNIIKALILLHYSDGKTYQLKQEGEPDQIVRAVEIEVDTSTTLNGTIQEVS